jgi:fused signal recognition particle receptor
MRTQSNYDRRRHGAGKTTTIAKLCQRFQSQGKKVLVGAADTFRAAAIEQLKTWIERVGADGVFQKEGSDPSAVAFDSVQAARAVAVTSA